MLQNNQIILPVILSHHHEERLSLTKVWEYILHTKSLPDNIDIHILYTTIRDRLRDAEKEVRQHALRVLYDLIPITDTNILDRYMHALMPEIISNLDNSAPALRTGAIDSLRIYLYYTKIYDQILNELLNADTDSSTIVASVPFFINLKTKSSQLAQILDNLFNTAKSDCINHEAALKSLARIKYIIGDIRFKKLLGEVNTTEYRKMCDTLGLPTEINDMDDTEKKTWTNNDIVEDRVILETEITLESGPAITMQIHEESRPNSVVAISESEEDSRRDVGVVRVLTDDSESDFYEQARKTPRKVRFGGEVVKMRTPESDSSNQENEDGNEESTTIHITVTDAVSIRTKRSLIPIRITSLPSTPKKSFTAPRRLHMSTPNLSAKNISHSRIPLRYKSRTTTRISVIEKPIQQSQKPQVQNNQQKPLAITYPPEVSKENVENRDSINQSDSKHSKDKPKETEATLKIQTNTPSQSRRNSRQEDVFSPIPVHNEIELFHNLTRSPDRSRKSSISEPTQDQIKKEDTFKETLAKELKTLSQESNNNNPEIRKTKEEPEANENDKPKENVNKWSPKELSFKHQESPWMQKDQNDNWPTISKDLPGEASKENYNSFKVCPSESQDEKDNINRQSLHQSLQFSDLHGEEEIWAKTEALDNLIFALEQPKTCSSLEPGPAALLFEALFACQHRDRLHGKADQALEIMIRDVRKEVLEQCMGRLAPNCAKIGAPRGVRQALMVMKRCPAKKFQVEVIERGYGHRTREGSLQILMAATRHLPSVEVEVYRATQFASIALRDRRRKVRHAALELLATLAQIRSNSDILEIVEKTIAGCPDLQHVLRVVRTRLSRRQLPSIENDGTVRYSSPRDQLETEWISGITMLPSSDSSSSSATSVNYWRHNLRHEDGPITDLMIQRTKDSDESLGNGNDATQIWAVDSAIFSKLNQNTTSKVTPSILRPVYILQPDKTVGGSGIRGHKKYDRGRSISPPKPQKRIFYGSHETLSASAIHNSSLPVNASSKPYDGFRKSFSSEQLYQREKSVHEPYSFSLSSRSSTTSTGSSTRSGIWQKDFRSGIPVPITSETKLRFRNSVGHSNGPVVARRSVLNGTQDSPVICRVPPQVVGGSPHLVPPKSSGSESSGYFTPPPDTHQAFVKLDTEESMEPDTTAKDCVDCFAEEDNQRDFSVSSPDISDANESDQSPHVLGEQIENKLKEELTISRHTLEDIEYLDNEPIEFEKRNKSKSVVELQTFLPEINNSGRKSVNSAPPFKDDVDFIRPSSVMKTFNDESPISPAKVSLPGALECKEEIEPGTSKTIPSSRLSKRFSRTQSRRSFKATPRTPAVESTQNQLRPFSKPKEALQQALHQMDSSEWEVTIQGLHGLVRMIRFHPDQIENNMHAVCVMLAKHIRNLRSQVARTACQAATDLFSTCKKGLDMEVEEIAAPLLQRTADTNKFLRADANSALDVMAEHLPLGRVVAVVSGRGCGHQNAVVRAASSRILCDLVQRHGADKIIQLPKETRDRIFLAAGNSLADGSLETRRHAKGMFSILMLHPNFQRHLFEAVPQHTVRHITKALNSIKSGT